jgi:hypothetical protein
MSPDHAQTLRLAIENLINAKLHDALARPGGVQRLIAHRCSGIASFDIRNAEHRLEQTLTDIVSAERKALTKRHVAAVG